MNFYQILGIPESAPAEDIKKAYRALAKEWHPDKNSSKEATKKMAEINKAYEVLKDEARKDEYDYLHSCGKYAPKPRKPKQSQTSQKTASAGAKRASKKKTSPGQGQAPSSPREPSNEPPKASKTDSSQKTQSEPPKESPKSSASKRAFDPNHPCKTCAGAGRVKIAQGFQSVYWVCPSCEGVGSKI